MAGKINIEDLSNPLQRMIKSTTGAIAFFERYTVLDEATNTVPMNLAYNKAIDAIFVFANNQYISKYTDYKISDDNGSIVKTSGKWSAGTTISIIVLKTVPEVNASFDGAFIYNKSIQYVKLSNECIKELVKDINDNYTIDGNAIRMTDGSNEKTLYEYIVDEIKKMAKNNLVKDSDINLSVSINNITNLQTLLVNLNSRINELEKRPRFWSGTTDPGSNAKNGDVWYDQNLNVFKSRVNNSWTITGSKYNPS